MRIEKRVVLALVVIIFVTTSAYAKGWRGIVPLHATRADVERLLGPPAEEKNEFTVFYRTAAETVIINYVAGLPCGIGPKYSQWKVSRNTVQGVMVSLTTRVSLSTLGINEGQYKKRSGGHRPQDIYYVNDQEGQSIRVFAGEVQDIDYYPAESDYSLACPGLVPKRESDCDGLAPPHFDFYANIDPEVEKSRLDNFVITLMDEKDCTGYIIAYAGKRARPGEAKAHAEQAKRYLVTIRHFPEGRLQAINGGYREEPEVDLYVVSKGMCPPGPTPTVDPRDVNFVRARSSRSHANNLRK